MKGHIMAKKWIVKIPYEGTAYIPIERDEEPKNMWDEEISSKLHTGYFDYGMPRYFRDKGKIEEEDDRTFKRYKEQAERDFKKKSAMAAELDSIANNLEAQGETILAHAIDKVSDLIEAKYIKEKGHGTPGQPGYKPTLWYMITPGGKKVLVDQKS